MEPIKFPENLTNDDKAKLVIDFFHRSIMHHAMWFAEVMHQYGRERALQVLDEAWENSYNIQITRLSKVMGFEMDGELPQPLIKLSEAKLDSLLEAMAVNWLVGDGTWFQAVEFSNGMSDAKRCNDSCWAQFAPFEAWSVKQLLDLGEKPGLEGLKKALKFRLYAYINKQSITNETDTSFVFSMNDCRVQSARKRKGMDDYPCKSGGMVEFTEFARAIDLRIKTECIGCPPDNHPEEWFCSWKFTIKE
jgi:hypothetical protein